MSSNYQGVRSGRPVRQSIRSQRNVGSAFYRRQRHYFITRVYLLSIAFISITLLQWIIITSSPDAVGFFKDKYYISLVAALLALLLISIFGFIVKIRYLEPYNWIFAYVIVELETIGLLRSPLEANIQQIGISLIIAIIVNTIFAFIGIRFPRDLTKDILIVIILSLIFYVAASIILILVIVAQIYWLSLILTICTIILLLVYIIYISQLVAGDRSGSVRWNDFILAALMIYFNFVLVFSSTLYLWKEFIA